MGFGPLPGATSTLNLPTTINDGTYPSVVVQYGLAGTSGSAAELGTLAFVLGNTGAGGNGLAITSATLPSIVFRTKADNREWNAIGFDTAAFSGTVPKAFIETSGVDVPALSGSVTGATNANPIVITATAHGMGAAGTVLPVTLGSIGGNTNANGFCWAKAVDPDHFQLLGKTGNSNYTSGGTWQTNKTAPGYSFYHTSDYRGEVGYGAYVVWEHTDEGAYNLNDRVGNHAVSYDTLGSTLTLGNQADGGPMSLVNLKASISMSSGQALLLNTTQTGIANPAMLFNSGAGIYAASGNTIGMVVGSALATTNTSITAGSTSGTVTSESGISSGMSVTGSGILPGTTITISGTTVTFSKAAWQTNAAASLAFYTPLNAFLCNADGSVTFPGAVSTGSLSTTGSITATSAGNTQIIIIGGGAPGTTWFEMVAPQFGFGQDNFLEINQVISGTRVRTMTMKGVGQINLAGMPTSSSGLVSGDIYSTAGALMIVP